MLVLIYFEGLTTVYLTPACAARWKIISTFIPSIFLINFLSIKTKVTKEKFLFFFNSLILFFF